MGGWLPSRQPTRCSLPLSRQPGTSHDALLHHDPAARQLANLCCLRIRLAFAEGRAADALDDAIAGLTLARHVTTDGTTISWLTGVAIETIVTDTLAAFLPTVDRATMQDFRIRRASLPLMSPLARCLATEEKAGLDWFLRRIKQAKDREQLLKVLVEVQHAPADQDAKTRELLARCGGTAEGVLQRGEEVRAAFADATTQLPLPPEQFDKAWATIRQRMAKNPLFDLLAPSLGSVRRAEARLEVRRALWWTASAIVIDGKEALDRHTDPGGDGPFEYEAFDGGFVLRSKAKTSDGRPLTLIVGKRENE